MNGSPHTVRKRHARPLLFAIAWLLLVVGPPARATISFVDVAQSVGLDFTVNTTQTLPGITTSLNRLFQRTMGNGAAVGDYDGDGDLDIYVLGHLGQPNRLYRNEHPVRAFTDVAPAVLADAGLSRVAAFADLDNDGDPDLVVVADDDGSDPPLSRCRLFRNDGGNIWTDVSVGSGFRPIGYLKMGLGVGDFDDDGWLDLYVTNWGAGGTGGPSAFPGENQMFRNLGGFLFQDVSAQVGLDGLDRDSFSPVLMDFDGDDDLDLHVAVDHTSDEFYRNDGGTYTNVTTLVGTTHVGNDMGVAIADYDDDGDLDMYSTNISDPLAIFGPGYGNAFYENQEDTTSTLGFVDVAAAAGVEDTYWGWGTDFVDVDNDGDVDLVTATGFDEFIADFESTSHPLYQTPSVLFENGPAGFTRLLGTGLDTPLDSRGLAAFDYDRDGDQDLLILNQTEALTLYENQTTGQGGWLTVRLTRDALAYGSSVRATLGATTQLRAVVAGDSYVVGTPPEVHFGLGAAAQVDELRVRWADGTETVLLAVPGGQVLTVSPPVADSDGDGLSDDDELLLGTNPADPDSDGDGVFDGIEAGSPAAPRNTDGDGVIDPLDVDDDEDGVLTIDEDGNGNGNPADDDSDGDAIPDYLEADSDDDGVLDAADNCPIVANPSQSDLNGDGFGDPCQPDDIEGDGWPNDEDNCPVTVNPSQADSDMDGTGDACEDDRSAARQWNEELLTAIRRDFARPTVHARNLYHVSAAMWDAWAAYDPVARQVLHHEKRHAVDLAADRAETISYAAYRILEHRFAGSPGEAWVMISIDARMSQLGYDPNVTSTLDTTPASLGNRIAETILTLGLSDGSNEQNDYANLFYQPANPPLIMALPGNPDQPEPNRWQPLALQFFVDQSGNPVPGGFPPFLSPEWGQVTPFALSPDDAAIFQRDGFDYWVYHDPGPPFLLQTPSAEDFLDGFEMVAFWSSHLDPADGVMWDISPASNGNAPLPLPSEWRSYYDFENGGDWGTGYATNPATGQPYVPQIVPRADYARVLAEFWADGPDSETPPGHWFDIANYVSDEIAEKRFEGSGPILDDLEWDVKLYLALGGTMHDVAVAVWGMKGWYDYVRPVSALRTMAEKGQRSDAGQPNYDLEGFELRPGFIELVTAASSLPGQRHAHLSDSVGEVAILAWRGPAFIGDPENDVAGVDWILAKDWWPYQRPSFVTPPFAGFPSGHSAYSRAAAIVLDQFTGDPFFPGGMGEFVAPMNEFLVFEDGPSVPLTLQYATYYDASDQTSLSRIWGGIHPPQDDIVSRHIGATIAGDSYALASAMFDGTPACMDGFDSDGDGLVDFPADPGCASATAEAEDPACQDGIDNDNDGLIDFDGGLSATGSALAPADPYCTNGAIAYESAPAACGVGPGLALLLPLLAALRNARRRRALD